MQKKSWVRVGLAGVIVGGALGGMSAAGCSSDDSTGTGGADSGTKGDSSVTGDTGTSGGDTGTSADTSTTDVEAAAPIVFAKVYIVHAAVDPNAPPVRLCFGLGSPADGGAVSVPQEGIPAFPDTATSAAFPFPGLFPGFGGSVSSSPKLSQFDLQSLTISLYVLNAANPVMIKNTAAGGPDGGAEIPCEGLIGTDALGTTGKGGGILTPGTDYFYVGTVPSGTFKHGTTWVGAITGCAPGETVDNAAFCPTGYNATSGDLTLTTWQVDNKTPVDGGIGAQFANASIAWDTTNKQLGGATTAAGFWSETLPSTDGGGGNGEGGGGGDGGGGGKGDGGDAGSSDAGLPDAPAEAAPPEPTLNIFPITGTGVSGTLSPTTLATVPVPLNSETGGFFAAFVAADGGTIYYPPTAAPGSGLSPLLYPLPVIDELSNPIVPDGGSFTNGQGYVFILIGDPNQPQLIGADGGASPTGAFNGKFPHFLGFTTSNP